MPSGVSTVKDAVAIGYAKNLENVPWCDDYEKMISGMLYSCEAPELEEGRVRARKLAAKFNAHLPDDATMESLVNDRIGILRTFFGHVGDGSTMEPNIQVDYGCNIHIGERFYGNFNTVILDCALVKIGDRVLFGTGVSLITATHETSIQSRRDGVEYALPITIGDDCWLGSNVTVLPGVTIGNGCTIAAGSIVSKDVPEYSVAMFSVYVMLNHYKGVPARVVKKVERVSE